MSCARRIVCFSVACLLGILSATAQQNANIAEATHPLGFYLKKVVSDTSICAGQTFSYTIYYSFPAGTQQVTITDQIPQPLLVQSVTVNNACGTPSVTAPSPGTNGTVSIQWTSVPSGGCSGSLTIVVSFPNGTTCNGTAARNRVCLVGIVKTPQGNQVADFCTPFVSTTAQATNPWQIQKQILGATWAGGNCPWKYAGDTVTYKIQICKNNPSPCGTFGQLNLVNGIVTDVLPSGAQFIGASCPNVSYNSATQTITWNVGNLSATQPYNCASCNITVYYPPSTFPTNTQITNTATLSGQLGSAQNPCGQFTQNTSVCWTKVLPPPPTTTASLWKWVSTNAQPGCGGYYYIRFCNTGNTTINSATIEDTIPSSLTITSTSPASGVNISTTGNMVTATLSSPLQPGQCCWFYVYFTISPTATPNSTITNCAWAQVPGLAPMQSCASFVVNAPAPSACIQKEICSPQASYAPGQVIRVRFRLQNIGGQAINGATLTDNLNPNFEYIGNPTFYTSTSWNTPCNPQGGISPWSPSPSLSVSGQTITVSNITIPATCQNLFWNGCGFYGNTGVPYYWVEFDVKIRDTAALGNIPNFYTLSGGGLPQPVQSNTVLVLVTGNAGFTLDKSVAPDTSNWQSSLTTNAGSTVYYRLRMNLTGTVGLRHVTFVDLLPRNDGASDSKILQACGSRGSQYDVTYQSLLLSSPLVPSVYSNAAATLANANAIPAATGAPANLFPNACGTAGSWSPGATAGSKNVGFYFGSGGIGTSTPPAVVFAGKLSSNAQPAQIACNTFAAGGAVRHYLNSTTSQDVPIGPLESGSVCVMIDTSSRCYSVQLHGAPPVPVGVVSTPKGNACKYQITVSVSNPGAATQGCAYSNDGQVSPASFSIPTGTSTLTLTFVDIPPQNNVACIIFGIPDASGVCQSCDTLCFDLRPCPQQDTCCPRFGRVNIKCIGRDTAGNMTYSIVATGTIPCNATLLISSPEGSFTPSAFSVGPGAFTIATTFTDLPPAAPGVITVYYTVMGQGVVLCRDSARVQLPPCPQQPRNCCDGWSRHIQSTVKWFSNGSVQITGTISAGPAPIHRFAAAIVSAQRKRWCPIIPPPPSSWQRIFGDFTSGWLIPAPGAPQMLAPYTRQLVWEGPIPDSCVNWSQPPASFQLNALFPAPSIGKCGDTLRFTVRYTFTDCECRTCDTLITYTIVRHNWLIAYPWDNIAVKRVAPDAIDIVIPGTQAVSDDSSQSVALGMIELRTGKPSDVQVYRCERDENCEQPADDVMVTITEGGCVIIFTKREGAGYRIRKIDDKLVVLQSEKLGLTWSETNLLTGESQEATEERELSIPPYSDQPTPTGTLVQDRESLPPHVRTFALAFVNGDQPVEGIEVELTALPQPDGTVPSIIAIGPVDGNGVVIKCSSRRCPPVIEQPLAPGEVFRPLYITVAGAKRDALDAVEVEYILRDLRGTIVGKGRVLLEGAVSSIEEPDEGPTVGTERVRIGSIIPNPASETVTVGLRCAAHTEADLVLYDAAGRYVATLMRSARLPAGTTAVPVDVSTLPAGVYTLVVRTPHGVDAQRLVVVR